ncbi:MAG TPA: hypothetical protein VMD27_06395 [Candidatus Aquilonibacter sp.]|nr:hypothetical protein [Candidatus Aquilonibacter sp.]
MESWSPQFDPFHNSENYRSIFQRMARANWLKASVAMPDGWWLSLNDLGNQRFDKTCDDLIRFLPDFFKAKDLTVLSPGSIKRSPAKVIFMLVVVTAPFFCELMPPEFSEAESDTLFGMLLFYAFERGKKQNLPDEPLPPARRF